MADEALEPTEELELADEVEQDAPEAVEPDDDEEILTFGDTPEEVAETDNAVIRHLREELKKARKDAAAASRPKADDAPVDPGPRPTLEQYDYDEDKHAEAIEAWAEKKVNAKAKVSQSTEAQEAELEATRKRIADEKAALGRPDVEEAFELVRDTLTETQQSALVGAADHGNTAKLIYALAKNPDKLASLAGEQNIARFIKEVGKLEGQLKMVKRRKAPEPDVPEKGSGKISHGPTATQKQIEILEKEADKTGDRTALIQFKKQHRVA